MNRRRTAFGLLCGCALLAAIAAAYAGNPGSGADTTADLVLGQDLFVRSGPRANARQLLGPSSVAVDRSVTPNRLFIVDPGNNRVLGYSSVAALASGQPADLVIGQPDFLSRSSNNGGVSANSLNQPAGAAVDPAGNLYVADSANNRVLEYQTPFSKGTTASMVFGQPDFGSNTRATSSVGLALPTGLAVDNGGNLFVADTGNDRVVEYNDPLATDAVADLIFGQHGASNLMGCNTGGLSASSLCKPAGVAVDAAGNFYVVDNGNNRVLEYDSPLTTDVIADMVFGQAGNFTTGTFNSGGVSADTLANPFGATVDSAGNLYVDDTGNNRVLEFDLPASNRNTSGDRVYGQAGSFSSSGSAPVSAASLSAPQAAALDSSGHLYIADSSNDRVLEFDAPLTSATATLVLGQTRFDASTALADATAIWLPAGIAVDTSVSPNRLYLADFALNRVLGFQSIAALSNGAPADIVIGQADLFTTAPNFDGISANSLNGPSGVAVDAHGNLYVADAGNNRMLEYNEPFITDSAADMVFGTDGSFTIGANPDNPDATSLLKPAGVAVDANGTVYVADTGNNRVLGFPDPAHNGTTASIVLGQDSFTDNTANNISAHSLASPYGLAVDGTGNLYVADTGNLRALIFSAPVSSQQSANLVIGTSGAFDVGGRLRAPVGIGIDPSGTVYILERDRNRALAYGGATVDIAGQVFGQSDSFTSFNCNQSGGPASPTADTLCESQGFITPPIFAPSLAADSSGNLFIADALNGRMLEYLQPPPPSVKAVELKPGAIDFGDVQTTTASSRGEAVYNNQSVAITANFSVNGSSDFFTQSASCDGAIDSTCINNVIFAPSKTGMQSAQLTVTIAGPGGGPFTVSLTGNGVVSTPTPTATATATATPVPTATATPVTAKLTVSTRNLGFGTQPFAESGNPSGPKRITFFNRGRVVVSLRPPMLVGNNPGDFQINPGDASSTAATRPACGESLAPRHKCAIVLRFKPTDLGPRSAALMLESNALNGAPAVSLSGQGTPPRLQISPGTLGFGTQPVNTSSVAKQIVLNNRSPVAIAIEDISVDNAEFAADRSCVGVLGAGVQCSIGVTFTPTTTGKIGGFLSIHDNAAGFIQQIRLSGTGD